MPLVTHKISNIFLYYYTEIFKKESTTESSKSVYLFYLLLSYLAHSGVTEAVSAEQFSQFANHFDISLTSQLPAQSEDHGNMAQER